ncbi:hypothetical protein BO94DRAFT_606985 [Aspergillus sclerotioniger CBS 115572]|uniref:Oxidoreductase acuF-like C2H2 type zinc-finger domain-containing protein n=1 Tax=Aspergillus sclerotioniger CBS 115572 TaxID=1450535 RepID=A0A317VJN7_9EURO|nr:hypothetical protein BO94DRAFT_606985 [Aspergillus sclerotioniger CBS 115572]PWY74516.1 hypothetical protein BO94DRAFT_606985 [Aspergillus sclerotioniger CBS 115572]
MSVMDCDMLTGYHSIPLSLTHARWPLSLRHYTSQFASVNGSSANHDETTPDETDIACVIHIEPHAWPSVNAAGALDDEGLAPPSLHADTHLRKDESPPITHHQVLYRPKFFPFSSTATLPIYNGTYQPNFDLPHLNLFLLLTTFISSHSSYLRTLANMSSIFEAYRDCEYAFDGLLKATLLYEGPYHRGVIKDVADYKDWAYRVGAAYGKGLPEYSLDETLREASSLREIIPKQLALLEKCVLKVSNVVDMETNSTQCTQKCLTVWEDGQFDDGDCQMARPHNKEYVPCDGYDHSDGDTVSTISASASEGCVSESTAQSDPPEATDLQVAVNDMRKVMQDLESLGLDDLEAADGPNGAYDEEAAFYEDWDVLLVQNKFDNRFLADDVKRRLGKMITRCRQLLCDRRKEKGPVEALSETLDSVNNPDLTLSSPSDDLDLTLEVPLPPVELKEGEMTEFECGYCYRPVRIDIPRAWEAHVIKDLQPYVCTYTRCDSSQHFFQNMEEWIEHEKIHDGVCYWCNQHGHETYEDRKGFVEHILAVHDEKVSSPLAYFCHRSLNVGVPQPGEPEEVCNLCFERTWDRKKHVARHLQQLAMYALDWEDGTDDYYEADSDT